MPGERPSRLQDEFIRVLSFYSERVEDCLGKVFEAHRHNDIRSASDRGGKDMAVAGIALALSKINPPLLAKVTRSHSIR